MVTPSCKAGADVRLQCLQNIVQSGRRRKQAGRDPYYIVVISRGKCQFQAS